MNEYRVFMHEDIPSIELLVGPYQSYKYTYGKVELVPDYEKGALHLKFEYTMIEGDPDQDFEQYIGRLLHEMIDEGLLRQNIVYSGGVDEVV